MANLTQKERMLLEDQKKHEEVCIQKYAAYAQQAQDPALQQIFQAHAQHEQQHYDTINQILNGQVPNMMGQQQQQGMVQQQGMQGQQMQANQGMGLQSSFNQQDAKLCNDMLMTEKYVSGAYDTAIFEFSDTNIRQALNHIQKEEQQHGEDIFNYMQSTGMYKPQ